MSLSIDYRLMIESVRVRRYRSIVDTDEVSLNEDSTTLVGGNEAGKTNFLKAIDRLGDTQSIPRDDLCDYLDADTSSLKLDEIPILEVSFLSNSSVIPPLVGGRRFQTVVDTVDGERVERVVRTIGRRGVHHSEGDLDESTVTIRRYADGTHYIQFEESDIERDYLSNQIVTRTRPLVSGLTAVSIADEIDSITARLRSRTHRSDRDPNTEYRDLAFSLQEYLRENSEIISSQYESSSDSEEKTAQELLNEITDIIESYRDDEGIIMFYREVQQLPDVQYFSDIVEIEDEVHIDKIIEKPEEYPAYSSILSFARLDPENLNSLDSGEIRDRRQDAGEAFTDLFNEFWSQSNIEITIELSGGRVSLQFYDESDQRKSSSDRSKGLRRFVSFLSQVVTQSEDSLQNTIVLLDSPDVHLHPEGQKNLRDSLSSLSNNNQLITATHAPYMIDTDDLGSIRVVERVNSNDGTKITGLGQKETASSDSLASVRAALGATFSDSLFSSSHSLLVEGYEDRVYLNSFSRYLVNSNTGISFDPKVQIVDCGGATKTSYMGRLVEAENYNYAVLLDDDGEGRRAHNQLEESGLPSDRISYVSEYIDTSGDSTIEDLLPRDILYQIVSDIHDVPVEDLTQEEYNEQKGVVWNLDGRLKEIHEISENVSILNKRAIAEQFSENMTEGQYTEDELGQDCIDVFINTISDLNNTILDNDSEVLDSETAIDEDSADPQLVNEDEEESSQ